MKGSNFKPDLIFVTGQRSWEPMGKILAAIDVQSHEHSWERPPFYYKLFTTGQYGNLPMVKQKIKELTCRDMIVLIETPDMTKPLAKLYQHVVKKYQCPIVYVYSKERPDQNFDPKQVTMVTDRNPELIARTICHKLKAGPLAERYQKLGLAYAQ